MKEFILVLRRFVPPYKKYLVLSVVFNLLSAVLNIFSFAAIIPILQILFKTGGTVPVASLMPWDAGDLKAVMGNNFNYYTQQLIGDMGKTTTLLVIGLFLAFTTFLKTGLLPLVGKHHTHTHRRGARHSQPAVPQDYIPPLGFFSEERKGDIIARMSGDVQEIESSIMSSLDMLFKNPVLIISYFSVLLFISWQLTLFTLAIVPVMGWFMGYVPQAQEEVHQGTEPVERHHEPGGGDPGRPAHHQGLLRRGEDEPAL